MSDSSSAPPPVDLHGRTPWSILPALLAGFFMIMLDTTIVNIAIPTLVDTFDATLTEVGWVNSAYLLTFAVLLLVTGRLGDTFGPRPVYMFGLVVFTLASLASGLAPSIGWLIAARAVQGIGGALMTPQTQALITRVFPPKQRGAALGMWGAVAGVATIAGPLLGGLLVETAGWEWIFFVNLPVGVIALFLSITRLPRLATQHRRVDWLGVGLSIVGMFLLVFGLQEGNSYDWGEIVLGVTVWHLVGVGLLLLAVFGWWQWKIGEDALLPVRLFANRNYLMANVAVAAVSFAMIGIFFPFTLFLQEILGLTPITAALVALPGSLAAGVVAPFAGKLSDRVSPKWVISTGFIIYAISIFWISAWIDADASPWRLLAPMTLFGFGTGAVMSPLANVATSGLDHRTAGIGAGAFNTNRQIGGVLGSAAIIALLTSRLTVTITDAAQDEAAKLPQAYQEPFLTGFSHVSGNLNSVAPDLPASMPPAAVEAINAAAASAVSHGFALATSQTLLLAAVVTVVGAIAAISMRGGQLDHQEPEPNPETEELNVHAA